ncbi:hypothetical protein Q4I30_000129, partial [Leishmania utingensis]
MSSAMRYDQGYGPAAAERRPIAMWKGAAPPLHRTAARAGVAATFVRPPRNPPAAVPASAAVPRAAPVLSMDRGAERGCNDVAPATVAAAMAPAVCVGAPAAQSMCGTR